MLSARRLIRFCMILSCRPQKMGRQSDFLTQNVSETSDRYHIARLLRTNFQKVVRYPWIDPYIFVSYLCIPCPWENWFHLMILLLVIEMKWWPWNYSMTQLSDDCLSRRETSDDSCPHLTAIRLFTSAWQSLKHFFSLTVLILMKYDIPKEQKYFSAFFQPPVVRMELLPLFIAGLIFQVKAHLKKKKKTETNVIVTRKGVILKLKIVDTAKIQSP